jgi:L-alanine-DL-glutamate epimerase-like enolase superfamily enzyme
VKIQGVRIFSKDCQLIEPYELSFATLSSFKSNFIEIELENRSCGIGEATALPGYGSETFDQISRFLEIEHVKLKGATLDQGWQLVNQIYSRFPFAASAIGTALEFASREFVLPEKLSIPLLYPVSASRNTELLIENVRLAFERGYRTIKVKIGKDLETDLETARALLQASFNVRYRFDANQGYTMDNARRFLDFLVELMPERVDYLEQPLLKGSWKSDAILCKEYPDRILLDESIYNISDIRRAADIGAGFVKLKQFKTKGLSHLLDITRHAKDMGLKVVLGNGVATDICNMAEAIAYSSEDGFYFGAFEGNGYLKLRELIHHKRLSENNGQLVWCCSS